MLLHHWNDLCLAVAKSIVYRMVQKQVHMLGHTRMGFEGPQSHRVAGHVLNGNMQPQPNVRSCLRALNHRIDIGLRGALYFLRCTYHCGIRSVSMLSYAHSPPEMEVNTGVGNGEPIPPLETKG